MSADNQADRAPHLIAVAHAAAAASRPTTEVSGASLKRAASPSFEHSGISRKRHKEDSGEDTDPPTRETPTNPDAETSALAHDLQTELECGICSALAYKPVIVNPCQHFFCGRCAIFNSVTVPFAHIYA